MTRDERMSKVILQRDRRNQSTYTSSVRVSNDVSYRHKISSIKAGRYAWKPSMMGVGDAHALHADRLAARSASSDMHVDLEYLCHPDHVNFKLPQIKSVIICYF